MTQANEASERPASDEWDMLDKDTYWQPLPGTTVNGYLSGETDIIYVRRDDDRRWWVSITNEIGASDYEKLEDAKAAGDEVIARYYADQRADIAADLGVSLEEWEISLSEVIELTSRTDGSIEIYGHWYGGKADWSFDNGNISVTSSSFEKVLGVAKAEMASSPAPR